MSMNILTVQVLLFRHEILVRSDIDIDLIRLGGLIGPIYRSTTSVLDSCLMEKHGGTLLPQILYYIRAFHLLNMCSAIYVLVPVFVYSRFKAVYRW